MYIYIYMVHDLSIHDIICYKTYYLYACFRTLKFFLQISSIFCSFDHTGYYYQLVKHKT